MNIKIHLIPLEKIMLNSFKTLFFYMLIINPLFANDLGFNKFVDGEMIKSSNITENFQKIKTELELRGISYNFQTMSSGEDISKLKILNNANNFYNLKALPPAEMGQDVISANSINNLFTNMETTLYTTAFTKGTCSLVYVTNCKKTWIDSVKKYEYDGDSSLIASAWEKVYFPLESGQSIKVNITGSIVIGDSGNYVAPEHTSPYGNNSEYSYVANCPLGSILYKFGTQGLRCLVPNTTITNDSGALNNLILSINDNHRVNNIGDLTLKFIFRK